MREGAGFVTQPRAVPSVRAASSRQEVAMERAVILAEHTLAPGRGVSIIAMVHGMVY
jgi:hypothetical protein